MYGLDFSEERKWGYGLMGAEETGFLNEGTEAIILLGFSAGGFWASRSFARRIAICFNKKSLVRLMHNKARGYKIYFLHDLR